MPNLPLNQTIHKRNLDTSRNWQQFAQHRERLATLLESQFPSKGQRLCILGAGNCNDLDLPRLLQTFDRITLIDLDDQAMAQGVARQLPADEVYRVEQVCLDVTGAFDRLNSLAERQGGVNPTDLSELASLLRQLPAVEQLGRRFDCVISTCLLSQLIDAVRSVVGEEPRRFVPLVQLLRRQHIETLLGLAVHGGHVALVFDFVSSVTFPSLEHVAEKELSAVADALVAQGNFFTGLKPVNVLHEFQTVDISRQLAGQTVLTAPWKWNLGPRWYLVTAVLATLR